MSIALDQALLLAHDLGDSQALIHLYRQAAQEAESDQATGFFLTHAYIFALECGDPRAASLRQDLVRLGRETVHPSETTSASP